MSGLTDGPVPHGIEFKPPVGKNLGYIDGPVVDPPDDVIDKAKRAVAGRAVDADDARLLLETCGLIDPGTPRTRPKKGVKP